MRAIRLLAAAAVLSVLSTLGATSAVGAPAETTAIKVSIRYNWQW